MRLSILFTLIVIVFVGCNEHNCREDMYLRKLGEASEKYNNFKHDTAAMKAAIEEIRNDSNYIRINGMYLSLPKGLRSIEFINDTMLVDFSIPPKPGLPENGNMTIKSTDSIH